MSKFSERAAAALELLPEELQERAVAFFLDEVDKLAELKREIALGMADVEAGRTLPWDPQRYIDRIDAIAKAKEKK